MRGTFDEGTKRGGTKSLATELAPFTFSQMALVSFFWCFSITVASMAALVEMGPKMARVARGKIRDWVRVAKEKIEDYLRERRIKRDQI